jgi:Transposase DDE domain group 1
MPDKEKSAPAIAGLNDGVLKPVVARYQGNVSRIYFRADAGFANPEVYKYLEAEGIKYAIRLPANRVLQGRIGYLLTCPVGRPPNVVRCYYANFTYRVRSWTKSRRVPSSFGAAALTGRPDRRAPWNNDRRGSWATRWSSL